MKFEVSSQELLKKLQLSAMVVVTNPVLPVTEDFLFNLDKEGTLVITTTNTDTTITTSLKVKVEQSGIVAVPSKILLDTLKALPDQPVSFSVGDKNAIELISSYGKYHLSGDDVKDFPTPPTEEDVQSFQFDCKKLFSAINKTIIATSNDEIRLAMTGVSMQIDFNKVLFVATDAHKLVKYTFFGISTDISSTVILPKKALSLLKAALPSEGQLEISFNKKFAFFKFGDTIIITKLVDGIYPDYNSVIPVENPNELTINKQDFLSSIKRISIYANKSTNQVILNMADNSLTISAQDLDFANEATEQLSCRFIGDPLSMGFNAKGLIEMLSNIESDDAVLNTSIPSKAGIIEPGMQEKEEHLMMLVMPLLANY